MPLTDLITIAAVTAVAVLLSTLVTMRLRKQGRRGRPSRRTARQDAVDTVAGWQPEAARVLTASEAKALGLLKRALPGFLVLAQVPLSRFLRVPTRNSYVDWLSRVGNLNVDLLLCDASSRVLAVIDIRSPQESERSRRRHERMVRVLRAAGIAVHVWQEDDMPSVGEIRTVLGGEFSRSMPESAHAARSGPASRPSPLIPVADITELLAAGDAEAERTDAMEPVPSGFFDDLESGRPRTPLH